MLSGPSASTVLSMAWRMSRSTFCGVVRACSAMGRYSRSPMAKSRASLPQEINDFFRNMKGLIAPAPKLSLLFLIALYHTLASKCGFSKTFACLLGLAFFSLAKTAGTLLTGYLPFLYSNQYRTLPPYRYQSSKEQPLGFMRPPQRLALFASNPLLTSA